VSVLNLYNGIYQILATDSVFLGFLGVNTVVAGSNTTEKIALAKAKHIQKRSMPQNIADNIPIVAFYTTGGGRESENNAVFNSTFIFDVYTADDVEKAHAMSNRILELFNEQLSPFMGVENFASTFIDGHESVVNLANIYCFTTSINMSINLDSDD
jgi:hypothetical protein